jgi:hypothetical protein
LPHEWANPLRQEGYPIASPFRLGWKPLEHAEDLNAAVERRSIAVSLAIGLLRLLAPGAKVTSHSVAVERLGR